MYATVGWHNFFLQDPVTCAFVVICYALQKKNNNPQTCAAIWQNRKQMAVEVSDNNVEYYAQTSLQ